MLNNILNTVKSTVLNQVTGNNLIPSDKKEMTIETATNAFANGLKQNMTLSNISQITELFTGKNISTSNPIISNISSLVVNELVKKVGLSQPIANTITSAIVPAVMNAFSHKINDPNDKEFNVKSLIENFTGGNKIENSILGTIGKLIS